MRRDGSLTTRDLVCKLDVLAVACEKCGRSADEDGVNRQDFLGKYLNISCERKSLLRRRAMRQLLGKTSIKRGVTTEVYLAEIVHCQACQATVPMGIEVVTVRKEGESKKVIRHSWYCRAHGADYVTRVLD